MSGSNEKLELPPSSIWPHIDYWLDSIDKKVMIGVKENKEKLLVKNEEEYTSPIVKIYKIEGVYIICTENSIYLVSTNIETRRISS